MRLVVLRRERCERHAVLGDDLGRDALTDTVLVLRIVQQRTVGVRVRIDEAGRDDQAGCVDRVSRLGTREVANRRDLIADDSDVGADARRARPINDFPAAQHQVKHEPLLLPLPPGESASRRQTSGSTLESRQ